MPMQPDVLCCVFGPPAKQLRAPLFPCVVKKRKTGKGRHDAFYVGVDDLVAVVDPETHHLTFKTLEGLIAAYRQCHAGTEVVNNFLPGYSLSADGVAASTERVWCSSEHVDSLETIYADATSDKGTLPANWELHWVLMEQPTGYIVLGQTFAMQALPDQEGH